MAAWKLDAIRNYRIYLILMQDESKILESPSSTLHSSSNSSYCASSPWSEKPPSKRFTRSNSRSRSKSREDQKQQQLPKFYVKHHDQRFIPAHEHESSRRELMRDHDRLAKREVTPVKSRRQIVESEGLLIKQGGSAERELEWLEIQRKFYLSEEENSKLRRINKNLQQKLHDLQTSLSEIFRENQFYKEKIKSSESKAPKERNSNLLRLKREIANQKKVDSLPAQAIQELRATQKELQILRESLARSESLRRQAENQIEKHRSERQSFFENLVEEMRRRLSENEELIDKLKIQINVLMVRQARQEDRAELLKNQQMQILRRKYGIVLKKYHEAAQELAAYRRKEDRANFLYTKSSLRTEQSSLSLSP